MTDWVDLHLHSACSDGRESPEALVGRAASLGAAAIALTDHDTTGGVSAAQQAAAAACLQFLPGVEISACFEGREMHIVGLGIDIKAQPLQILLSQLAQMRHDRQNAIIERLHEKGIAPGMRTTSGKATPISEGRMHLAVALHEMGHAASVQEAFDLYLNRGCPAYVPKELPEIAQAIEAIHNANGLAFIAHPGLGHWILKKIPRLLSLPFDGLEAWHPSHTAAQTNQILTIAKNHHLLVSGGSDCHGNVKGEGNLLGRIKTPIIYYHHIRDILRNSA